MQNLSFFSNPFAKQLENFSTQGKEVETSHLAQKAENLYKDLPYTKENKPLYNIALIFGLAANIISFGTTLVFISTVLNTALGVFSWVIGLLLALLIESLKNTLWKTICKAAYKYKSYKWLSIGILVLLHSLSGLASVLGAIMLPKLLSDNLPKSEQVFNFSRNYDNDILQLDNTILASESLINSYSKNITLPNGQTNHVAQRDIRKERANLENLKQQKEALIKSKALESETLTAQAKEQEAQKDANLQQLGLLAAYISVLMELIYVAATWYKMHYLFIVHIETLPNSAAVVNTSSYLEAQQPKQEAQQHREAQKIPIIASENKSSKQKIGFKSYDNSSEAQSNTNTVTYDYKDNIKIAIVNGKAYTKQQIGSNYRSYKSRYSEHSDRCKFWKEIYLNL